MGKPKKATRSKTTTPASVEPVEFQAAVDSLSTLENVGAGLMKARKTIKLPENVIASIKGLKVLTSYIGKHEKQYNLAFGISQTAAAAG